MTVLILGLLKLKRHMKRLLTILFGIILMTTTISSQPTSKDTVVTITPIQLKTANLIFAEHKLLSEKVPLLESKIANLEEVNVNLNKIDSLRSSQVTMYKDALEVERKNLTSLKKSLKTTKVIASSTTLASIILALVCILR